MVDACQHTLAQTHRICRRRQWHPIPVFLPGKSHGWRSLVGCSPRGHEELDTTERLHFHFSLSRIGEGNGNPTPVFLPGESQGWGSLVGCRLWGHSEVTQQQQQRHHIVTGCFFLVMRTLKIYSLANFKYGNYINIIVLLTIVIMLYLTFPELMHLIAGTLYPSTNISPFPSPPHQPLATTILLLGFYECGYFT